MVVDKDTVTGRKSLDRLASCNDFPSRLVPELARPHAIFAIYLFKVRAAEPAGAHPHQHVAFTCHLWHLDIVHGNCVVRLYKYGLH